MDKKDAFGFMTQSYRLVRLLSELQDAWKEGSTRQIGEFLQNWLTRSGVGNLADFSFVNQSTLIGCLYMSIVWYEEHQRNGLFSQLFDDVFIDKIDAFNASYACIERERRPFWPNLQNAIVKWDQKKKKDEPEPKTLSAFLAHIRNSLSHGRVEILEDEAYEFRDKNPPPKAPIHTRIRLSYSEAGQLADALYLSLALAIDPSDGEGKLDKDS